VLEPSGHGAEETPPLVGADAEELDDDDPEPVEEGADAGAFGGLGIFWARKSWLTQRT